LLWPGIAAWWGRTYNEHQTEWDQIFTRATSSKNYEQDVQVTGFGLAPIKREAVAVTYDSESQGFVKQYTHVTYALGYICSQEELSDGLYDVVSRRRAGALAFSIRQTKENVGANVLNRAFNASYTGGDGSALCVTTHPSKAGNWSNRLSTDADLSESAMEDMLIAIYGATNDRGLKINLIGQKLIVHRNDWFHANRLLKTTGQAYTADNTVNAVTTLNALPGGITMNHYLTDSDAWWITTNAPNGLKMYQRWPVAFAQDNDFDTGNAKAKNTERYSFGWTDPRCIWGTQGA
jgi:hypothetical protein